MWVCHRSADWDSALTSKPSYISFTHVHTQASDVSTCTQCLGVTVLFSLKVTWVILGGYWAPILPLRGRPNIWTWVLNILTGGAPLAGSCASLGSVVHSRPSPWLNGQMSPSSRSNCPLVPGRMISPGSARYVPWWQGRWKTTFSTILDMSPQRCCGDLEQRQWTLRQFNRK
jgi:hypothetical protein